MKFKYCIYARKSTERDEQQALSIDSQLKEMELIAERDELNVVDIKKESHSAKNSGERPVYNELINDLREDKYQGIITWQTDRLSRNAGDLGILVDLMDQKKLAEIRTYNQVFTNSPNDKFLLMILGSQAKLENDNKAINVKRGMKTKCEMGIRPCVTPLGYLNDPIHAKGMKVITLDKKRAPAIKKMFEMSAKGVSGRDILDWADSIGFTTRQGRGLSISTFFDMMNNPYYYGEFEWPKGSDNWYRVNHESIITKNLFDKVQERFKSMPKYPPNKIDFNYSGVIRCAKCGSSIIGEKKYKRLSNGQTKLYVYYMCSKYTHRKCSQKPISEDNLTPQLIELIDKVALDRFILRDEYEQKLKQLQELSKQLGINHKIDIRDQMKNVIENGTAEERRRLLKNLGARIDLKDRQIQHL